MPSDDVIVMLIEVSAYRMLRASNSTGLRKRWLLMLKGGSRGKKMFITMSHEEMRCGWRVRTWAFANTPVPLALMTSYISGSSTTCRCNT